jgi:hypothetical protein
VTLSKSKRVTVIQDIAAHLEGQDWTTIDLVLKQFGLPVTDAWSGDTRSYVVKMIGDASDADLIELAEHFGIPTPAGTPASAASGTPYWEEGKLKAFISHLSTNKKQAADLQTALSPHGMSCFVAHADIHPNAEWQMEIETAIATCELMIGLLYPEFGNSDWCDQEIGYALGRGVPVFTIKCGADPTGFVSRFQAFSGQERRPSLSQVRFSTRRSFTNSFSQRCQEFS